MIRVPSVRTLVILISIFIIGRNFIMVRPGAIEAAVSYVVYPVFKLNDFFISPVKRWYATRQLYQDINQRFEKIVADRDDLLRQLVEYKALMQDVQTLPELHHFARKYSSDYMVHARVLMRCLQPDTQTIIVDAGSVRGVTEDMVVVSKNNLVGRVSQVFPYYSKVVLITDATCKVAVLCSTTGAKGILEGKNVSNELVLGYVSHLNTVQQGDLVLTTGEGLIFPRGFCVGKVARHDVRGLTHVIDIAPVVDFENLEECYVLQKGAEYKERC